MRTVLYVDGSFDDRELMLKAAVKAKAKFELRLAEDYRGPVEYLSHQGFYEDQERFRLPDLVLLDYSLKGCKATDLLVWIRARSEIGTLPVVILSGNTADHVVAECYARGANYFVEKPARPEKLLELVRAVDKCLGTFPVQLHALKKVRCASEARDTAPKRDDSGFYGPGSRTDGTTARAFHRTRSGNGRAKGEQEEG